MYQEFTLVNPEDQCEVMADIDTTTGKILDLYCYASHLPVIENTETGHIYKINTKTGKNPLFAHIQRKAVIFKLLILNGFICCMPDEHESDYQNQVSRFEKSLLFNGIPETIHCY